MALILQTPRGSIEGSLGNASKEGAIQIKSNVWKSTSRYSFSQKKYELELNAAPLQQHEKIEINIYQVSQSTFQRFKSFLANLFSETRLSHLFTETEYVTKKLVGQPQWITGVYKDILQKTSAIVNNPSEIFGNAKKQLEDIITDLSEVNSQASLRDFKLVTSERINALVKLTPSADTVAAAPLAGRGSASAPGAAPASDVAHEVLETKRAMETEGAPSEEATPTRTSGAPPTIEERPEVQEVKRAEPRVEVFRVEVKEEKAASPKDSELARIEKQFGRIRKDMEASDLKKNNPELASLLDKGIALLASKVEEEDLLTEQGEPATPAKLRKVINSLEIALEDPEIHKLPHFEALSGSIRTIASSLRYHLLNEDEASFSKSILYWINEAASFTLADPKSISADDLVNIEKIKQSIDRLLRSPPEKLINTHSPHAKENLENAIKVLNFQKELLESSWPSQPDEVEAWNKVVTELMTGLNSENVARSDRNMVAAAKAAVEKLRERDPKNKAIRFLEKRINTLEANVNSLLSMQASPSKTKKVEARDVDAVLAEFDVKIEELETHVKGLTSSTVTQLDKERVDREIALASQLLENPGSHKITITALVSDLKRFERRISDLLKQKSGKM